MSSYYQNIELDNSKEKKKLLPKYKMCSLPTLVSWKYTNLSTENSNCISNIST